jgi:drug/metabolite transporter (DMT)-like permease
LLTLFQKYILSRPAVLLSLTMLMWAGNTVASKLATPEMSPMLVSTIRWMVTCVIMVGFGWRTLKSDWPKVKPHWKYITLQALAGFSLFNALFYYAAHLTSGINLSIIQGSISVFVLIGAFIWFGSRSSWLQIMGVIVSLIGVLIVTSSGKFANLQNLSFNLGDILFLIACLFSAIYTLGLRQRPNIPAISLFMFLAFAAFATSLPLTIIEYWNGDLIMPSLKGWLIMSYIIIFPSTISQLFYIRAIEMIGASRAGIFVNLIPVLGALLSVVILGETFGFYHTVSLGLVLAGIMLAEWGKPK